MMNIALIFALIFPRKVLWIYICYYYYYRVYNTQKEITIEKYNEIINVAKDP